MFFLTLILPPQLSPGGRRESGVPSTQAAAEKSTVQYGMNTPSANEDADYDAANDDASADTTIVESLNEMAYVFVYVQAK